MHTCKWYHATFIAVEEWERPGSIHPAAVNGVWWIRGGHWGGKETTANNLNLPRLESGLVMNSGSTQTLAQT